MQVPLEVCLKGVTQKRTIQTIIEEKAEKLTRVCKDITACSVAVEQSHKHNRKDIQYHIRIDISIPPHHDIVIVRDPGKANNIHDDLPHILREAFDAALRRVKVVNDKKHHRVKTHVVAVPEEIEAAVF